jgi:hypothetical protein
MAALLGGSVTASASAQVVRNVVVGAGDGPRVVLREAAHIGTLDGEHDSFGQIADVTLDRHGRVYVADNAAHRVSVFQGDGRFIATLGREGQGPGEFESPWLVRVDPNDSVFVWDMSLGRMSVFDPAFRFARSFAVPPQWMVNGILFAPGGELVIAAYGSGEQHPLQRLRRDGTRLGSFGPAIQPGRLAGFERSLLGGDAALDGPTLVYSNKSPYEVSFLDAAGRVRTRCIGRAGWTTPPADVVSDQGLARVMRWRDFVSVTRVVPLGGGFYLNVIHDPRTKRDTFDLLSSGCRLIRRTPLDAPVTVLSRAGNRIAGIRTLEYPEVVIYEFSVSPR